MGAEVFTQITQIARMGLRNDFGPGIPDYLEKLNELF